MFVIQVFIPLTEKDGQPFHAALFQAERRTLTEAFGGVTVYARAPASGFWERDDQTVRDEIAIFEVMSELFDHAWWQVYRSHLERTFQQERILVRAFETHTLPDQISTAKDGS